MFDSRVEMRTPKDQPRPGKFSGVKLRFLFDGSLLFLEQMKMSNQSFRETSDHVPSKLDIGCTAMDRGH